MVLLMEDDLHMREKYINRILTGQDYIYYVVAFAYISHSTQFGYSGRIYEIFWQQEPTS